MSFSCNICKQSDFKSKASVSTHKYRKHNGPAVANVHNRKTLSMDGEVHNLMTSKSKSMHHSGKNSNDNLDRDDNKICQCGKYFKSPSGLRLHKAFECQANGTGSLDNDDQSSTSSKASTDVLSDGTEDTDVSDDNETDEKSDSSNDTDVLSNESDILTDSTDPDTDEKTDGGHTKQKTIKRKRHEMYNRSKYIKPKRSKNVPNMDTDSDLSTSESESNIDVDKESVVSIPYTRRTRHKMVKSKREVMKKIWKNHNLTEKKLKHVLKGVGHLRCFGLEEYLNLFELMQNNEIDQILDNDLFIRMLHSLFNGLKKGWIPICGFQVLKLDINTKDIGKKMFEFIDKFKDGLSKDKLKGLISSHRQLVLDTFHQFHKPMMNYIELYEDYLNHLSTKIEQDKDFPNYYLNRK